MSILEHFVSLKSNKKSDILITDKKVGDILVEQNLITNKQLTQALHYQKTHPDYNGKVGEICVQLEFIQKIDLIKVVSQHYHIPLALAVLEKRDIAKRMQQEAKLNSILDNDFIDSLVTISQPDRDEKIAHATNTTEANNESNKQNLTKDLKPKITLNKNNKTIMDLVVTNRLQNGLINTLNSSEKKSVEYILTLIKSSDLDSAFTYINKVKSKYKHSPLFCQVEVFALIHAYKFEQAEQYLTEFNPDYDKHPQLLDLKSIIQQLLNQHDLAVKNYTTIIQTKKLSDHCLFALAFSLEQLNMSKQASKIYKHFTTLVKDRHNKQFSYAMSKI